VNGTPVGNAYTGWSGLARPACIAWPDHGLELTLQIPELLGLKRNDGYCLLHRPPVRPTFCFETVTHPIDACHMPGRLGLSTLYTGERLMLHMEWQFSRSPGQTHP
jgi:aldose 1-epimerase